MKEYGVNKALSIGIPLTILLLLISVFSVSDPILWLLLIVITHTLGYTHFILGFYYQLRAIIKSKNKRLGVYFTVLTILGASVSILSIVTGYTALLAIVAIGYFLIHGTLNEVTVMEKQFGFAPARSLMVPLVFFLLPFFLLSLTHPSFFFTPQLTFLNPPPELAFSILQEIISINLLQLVSLLSWALFIILVPLRLLGQGHVVAGGSILFVTLVTTYLFFDVRPINYVVLYFILLSYHFISWSLYFYQVYRRSFPERLPRYITHHAVILLPLIVLSLAAVLHDTAQVLHEGVFNGLLFITFAMIHNTTSLLNESWFQNATGGGKIT